MSETQVGTGRQLVEQLEAFVGQIDGAGRAPDRATVQTYCKGYNAHVANAKRLSTRPLVADWPEHTLTGEDGELQDIRAAARRLKDFLGKELPPPPLEF